EGINDSGTIVGTFQYTSGGKVNGFYRSSSGYHVVKFPNAQETIPRAISDTGVIAGWYLDSVGTLHGFTYANGTYRAVNYPGAADTEIQGINKNGAMVGFFRVTPSGT